MDFTALRTQVHRAAATRAAALLSGPETPVRSWMTRTLEASRMNLIYAKRLAVDEDGRVLVWTGGDVQ